MLDLVQKRMTNRKKRTTLNQLCALIVVSLGMTAKPSSRKLFLLPGGNTTNWCHVPKTSDRTTAYIYLV